MVKSRITTSTDGYLSLYKDLKFEVDNSVVYIPKKDVENMITLRTEDDYKRMLEELSRFTLTPEDINLISLRYGLLNGAAHTLHECGEQLNVTDECVRSRINSSFRKLKHYVNLQRTLCRICIHEREKDTINESDSKEGFIRQSHNY